MSTFATSGYNYVTSHPQYNHQISHACSLIRTLNDSFVILISLSERSCKISTTVHISLWCRRFKTSSPNKGLIWVHNLAIRFLFLSRLPHTLMRIPYKQMCIFNTWIWREKNIYITVSFLQCIYSERTKSTFYIIRLLYHTSRSAGLLIDEMWLLHVSFQVLVFL
jgi:hypothetical protein